MRSPEKMSQEEWHRYNAMIDELFADLITSHPVPPPPPPRRRWIMAAIPGRQDVLDRVLNRCAKAESGCWEWHGATSGSKGYGRMKIAGKLISPHRAVAWAMDLVDGLSDPERVACVLHRCDNPRCCNPKHLFVGSMSDNMQDCSRKGRIANQKNPWAPKQPKRKKAEEPPIRRAKSGKWILKSTL